MINKIKYFSFVFMVVVAIAVVGQERAMALPWLDFGDSFTWDPSGALYTDNGGTEVTSVTYLDGSSTSGSLGTLGGDPVIGEFELVSDNPLVIANHSTKVDLDLSFDGIANDTIRVFDPRAGGTVFLSAYVDIFNPAFDPVNATPNPFVALLYDIDVDAGPNSSLWATEFSYILNGGDPIELRLNFFGTSHDNGNGTFTINGGGKVTPTPTPEPGTIILLGLGLTGLAGAGIRRKRKQKEQK